MTSISFLNYLNERYIKLHSEYEEAFWDFRMGITKDGVRMNKGEIARDAFRSDKNLKNEVEGYIKKSKGEIKRRLQIWDNFFSLFQIPDEAIPIRKKVTEIEERMLKVHATRKEGYLFNGEFVEASRNKMRTMMRTHPDETIRKACFEAVEKLPLETLADYVEVIKYRNEYARILGYADFYDYKIHLDEGITKNQLFSIFDKIYEKTKYAFKNIRDLENSKPGLRKPWNFGYMMTGDFTKEEDPFFQFENVIDLWGRSFSALGIDYRGGKLKLDLLDRKGKWDNGFCHYPEIVHYDKKGKMKPGSSNFTSTAIPSQIGSGILGINTVFHEAGHAADRLNSIQKDACINTEYPPSTVSWAETHSMFMDSISSSVEWRVRYAKNANNEAYPFDIYERKLKALYPLLPLEMMHINFVIDFEKQIYECKNLTEEFVLETARKVNKKYFDYSEDSISILNVPHIYSWESSAYYHGYGLAELGVCQWRDYFYKKYGYIVDNPKVGQEMTKVWKLGSLYKSGQFIKIATGKKLSANAFIKSVTRPIDKIIKITKQRVARLAKVPQYKKHIKLNAHITMVHGEEKITDSAEGFENMAEKYKKWIISKK